MAKNKLPKSESRPNSSIKFSIANIELLSHNLNTPPDLNYEEEQNYQFGY